MRNFVRKVFKLYSNDKAAFSAIVIVLLFAFIAAAAPILASKLPWLVISNNSGIEMPTSPLLHAIIHPRKRIILERTDYRKLASEEKISAIFPPVPFSPYETNLDNFLDAPSFSRFGHPLGSDSLGRDVAARLMHGATNSMLVGLIAVGLAFIIGVLIGAMAGYFGGWTDLALSRFIEIVICFPTLILIMAVLALIKPSLVTIMVVIGLTGWTGIARVMRGEFLKRRGGDFVLAARLAGASHVRLILKHILPNSLAPLIVMAAFDIAGAVLLESSLSFLGIGVPAPEPSWGDILKNSQEYPDIAWWLVVFPGTCIFLVVVAFNFLGDWLRKALNPRERAAS